jgi:hypothetical protein
MPQERHRVFRYKSSFRYAAPLRAFRFNPLRKLCFKNNSGVFTNKARNLKLKFWLVAEHQPKEKFPMNRNAREGWQRKSFLW